MKRIAMLMAGALFAAACSDSTSPPVATSIVLSATSVSLDAIGATQTIVATVNDQHGQPMANAPVTWTSSSAVATVTSSSASSATVTSALNGSAVITAVAGGAKTTLAVTVAQQIAALQRVSGDAQTGAAGFALPQLIVIRAVDRMGAPVSAQTVTFAVASGGGSISPASATTAGDGTASATWTLGKVAGQPQTITVASSSAPTILVTGTAVAGSPASLVVQAGDKQTATVATATSVNPEVVVLDAFANSVANATVTFAAANGTVTTPSATSNTQGVASAGTWTLGTKSGAATITASIAGASPVTITATANAGAAADVIVTGGNQSLAVGTLVGTPPSARVVDAYGNGVAGVLVRFAVTAGGGTITGASATTDATGTAVVGSWRLGAIAGANTLTVTTNLASLPTRTITITGTNNGGTGVGGGSTGWMAIASTRAQAAMAGSAVPYVPSVTVYDASDKPVAGVAVTFVVTGGAGSITGGTTTTNANGVATVGAWTLGSVGALNTLSASTTNYGSVTFTAAGCEGGGAGFRITVCYRTAMTASQHQAFASAAARWGSIITSELTDVPASFDEDACDTGSPAVNMTIDDLLIFAGVEPMDGAGAVLGSAGWCFHRTGGLPAVGSMRFDQADMPNLESSNRLQAVILHEMGHVLGIGTMWGIKGLLQNPSITSVLDTYFNGAQAVAAFNTVGGASYTGQKVPVENTGGSGTVNAHWRESVLQNELMTGYLNSGTNPLSTVTVQSLQDIGYSVNASAADPFTFVFAGASASRAPDPGLLSLDGDIRQLPQATIDSRGRITRIR